MPIITGVGLSVAANAVSGNVLAGELFEFPPQPSAIAVAAVGAAAGLRATFTMGGTVIMNDQPISGANRFPIQPDDVIVEEGAIAGERLFLEFRNTTGAAITVDYKINITPV